MEIHEQKTQFFDLNPITDPALAAPQPPADIWLPADNGRSPQRPSTWRIMLEGLVLAVFFVLGTAVLVSAVWFYRGDTIMPGIEVNGVAIGTLSTHEATAVLQQSTRQPIMLMVGEQSWPIAPADVGLSLDLAATVRAAHEQGRSRASWAAFLDNNGRFDVPPVWQLDSAVAQAYLQAQAATLDVPPQDARLRVENGQVVAVPAVAGLAIDVAATQQWLAQNVAAVAQNGRLPLVAQTVPATVTDVSGLVAQAQQLLTTSVAIQAYDPITDDAVTWVLAPNIWGDWLQLDANAAAANQLDWSLDQSLVQAFLASRMAALGNGRYLDTASTVTAVTQAIQAQQSDVQVRIYHQDRQHTVQSGETLASIGRDYGIPYPWIQQANPGMDGSLSAGQILTVPSPDAMLPLPIVPNKRVVVSISQQRAWVYENGQVKWEWLASTGIASSPTAPGIFQIQSHESNAYAGNWDLWMPNFMGVYRPVPTSDFMNGFHGFPTRDGANLLWTNNLGTPVTYGCILLSNDNIKLLYDWAEDGVVVEILP